MLHCGALVSDWATTEEITRINVDGTRNLLRAAVDASVRRFVHFSTTDVYGHPGRRRRSRRPTRPRAFATGTRRRSSRPRPRSAASQAADALDAVILRPATVYGPGSQDVIGEIARAIQGRHMLLIDRGRAVAGLCYVENLVDAALLALQHEAAPGQAFNVSDGLGVTWRQFTDDLADGPRLPAGPLEPALPAGPRHRLLARARLPAAAPRHRR